MSKRHIVCLTFDFDAISGFIARGQTSPSWISRGEFGPRVGMPRLLALFEEIRHQDAPGSSPATPSRPIRKACEQVVEAGHEIAHHGWTHRPPASLTREEEEGELVRANEAIRKLTGREGARLPLAVVGPVPALGGALPQARLRLRQQPDGRRLHAVLRAPGRRDRAAEAGGVRQGDDARRDADPLVPPTTRRTSSSCAPRPPSARA